MLQSGRTSAYREHAEQLHTYVLAPYLEYEYLRTRLSVAGTKEVRRFLTTYPDLAVTPILHRRWLKNLGRNRSWSTLAGNAIETSDAELNCYQLRALYNTDQRTTALQQTGAAWVQPRSQPKACDPLFAVWLKSDYFSEAIAWQRIVNAVQHRQLRLARYLRRYVTGDYLQAAEFLISSYRDPQRLTRTKDLTDLPASLARVIVLQNLPRLADKDAASARKTWATLQSKISFSPHEVERTLSSLVVADAQAGNFPKLDTAPAIQSGAAEKLILEALIQQRWQHALHWIGQLPEDQRQAHRWQYWQARAMWEAGNTDAATPLLRRSAEDRQYYGFLAALQLGLPGKLAASNTHASAQKLQRVAANIHVRRSLELFAVGDDLNGRREWFAALRDLSPADQMLAAELALQKGMTYMAIMTANQAEATDHLHLRFPVVHLPQFQQASLKTGQALPTLLAVARQESALNHRAKSTAGARGLMQLMPGTARLVAQRLRTRSPSLQDLYDPTTNVELGSYHMAWLMNRYQQQLPLAIAAYNAGEHRVDRWIARPRTTTHGPMDRVNSL